SGTCVEGEVWKTGVSSSCAENKCGQEVSVSRTCTLDYASACFCQPHLFRRASDRKCVRLQEC
ncbi:hypothetical protein MTO96_050682, partial [Rhipicephalus appendiculatus]